MVLGSLLEVVTESGNDVINQISSISDKYLKLYEKELKRFAIRFNDGAVPISVEIGTMYVDKDCKGKKFDNEWLNVRKDKLRGKAQFCVVITFNKNKFVQMYKSDPKKAMSEADKAMSHAFNQAMSIVKQNMR